jgi:hypothetical protein
MERREFEVVVERKEKGDNYYQHDSFFRIIKPSGSPSMGTLGPVFGLRVGQKAKVIIEWRKS